MSDSGGDPACWAHLDPADHVTSFDTAAPAGSGAADGSGAVWSLPHGGGLDANVVRLDPRAEIGEHDNDQVDVLVVVWSGSGELVVDGLRVALGPGTIAHVPRGSRRHIVAGTDGLLYLSTHPRRDPITVLRPG